MAAASRRSRRFVVAGVAFLLVWQAATVTGVGRTPSAVLGVLGFVLHVVFGKAYALVPSYFERSLATSRTEVLHLPLSALGVAALAWGVAGGPPVAATAGAALWSLGVALFLGTLLWTVRDNLTGAETGTGEVNAHRRAVDRVANAAVLVALAYLAAGSYELLAVTSPLPALVGRGLPAALHLLAAGAAATTLFAVGFRLLPRFLVASPPRWLVALVLAAAAIGPALLAVGFGRYGPLFRLGAALEATAVVGFGLAFLALFVRTDRDRVGFRGVLAAVLSGAGGVALGLGFALGIPPRPALVLAHLRLNVLGLLGLSVVGVAYQFYPPAVGAYRASDDRTALASIAALAVGLWLEVGGRLAGSSVLVRAGALLGLLGAVAFTYLLAGTLRAQSARR
ncbi:MAG: hypothetical protein ABEJ74_08880 [Haloferacaceae archaeon]